MENMDDVFEMLKQARKELVETRKRVKADLEAARKKAVEDLKKAGEKTSNVISKAVRHAKKLEGKIKKGVEEKLVEFKPVASRAARRAVLTGVIGSTVLSNTADAVARPFAEPDNFNFSKIDEADYSVPSALEIKFLDASEINLVVEQVELNHPHNNQPYYEFTNRAEGNVKEFKDATLFSLWDASYMREVKDLSNPVGGGSAFLGSFQANLFNAQNVLIYAALHAEEYGDIANRFFNSGNYFNQALHKFKQDFDARGTLAFHSKQAAREKLAAQLKSGFKTFFAKEGKENPVQFLKLQRAYGSNIMAHFDEAGLSKIMKELDKSKINPEQISFGVWGMVIAKMVVNNYSGIDKLFRDKTAEEINNVKFIDEFANKFPDTFKEYSGPNAVKFAKAHLHEGHSVTTAGELSTILGKPEILDRYMKYLSHAQNKNITFSQAKEFMDVYKKLENSEVIRQKQEQIGAFLKSNIKISPLKVVDNITPEVKPIISPLMKNTIKAKKAKG